VGPSEATHHDRVARERSPAPVSRRKTTAPPPQRNTIRKRADLFSIEAVASRLGFNRRTVAAALGGVPADGNEHGRKTYTLRTVVDAMVAHGQRAGNGKRAKGKVFEGGPDFATERAGLIRAKREQAERKNALDAALVVRVEDVVSLVEEQFAIIREHLLGIAGKNADAIATGVAALLGGLSPQVVGEIRILVEGLIRDAIYEALTELSSASDIADSATAKG
jgi:hypothetical protein